MLAQGNGGGVVRLGEGCLEVLAREWRSAGSRAVEWRPAPLGGRPGARGWRVCLTFPEALLAQAAGAGELVLGGGGVGVRHRAQRHAVPAARRPAGGGACPPEIAPSRAGPPRTAGGPAETLTGSPHPSHSATHPLGLGLAVPSCLRLSRISGSRAIGQGCKKLSFLPTLPVTCSPSLLGQVEF